MCEVGAQFIHPSHHIWSVIDFPQRDAEWSECYSKDNFTSLQYTHNALGCTDAGAHVLDTAVDRYGLISSYDVMVCVYRIAVLFAGLWH